MEKIDKSEEEFGRVIGRIEEDIRRETGTTAQVSLVEPTRNGLVVRIDIENIGELLGVTDERRYASSEVKEFKLEIDTDEDFFDPKDDRVVN